MTNNCAISAGTQLQQNIWLHRLYTLHW